MDNSGLPPQTREELMALKDEPRVKWDRHGRLVADRSDSSADTRRVDWLQHTAASIWCNYTAFDTFTVEVDTSFMDGGKKEQWCGSTLRAAIDAAMQRES